jgi:hypothetical protein
VKSFHILALCAALGALATANSSQAGTITAHYGALGGTNFEHVSMIYSGNSYSFPTAKAFGTRTDDAPAGAGVDTLIGHNFVAYCVETGQDLGINTSNFHADVVPLLGATTQLTGAPGSGPVFFDATRTTMMERLWGGFESSVVDQHTAAAFQLAVWEVAFDVDQTLVGGASLLHAPALDLGDVLSAASIAEGWLTQVRNLNVALDTPALLLMTDPTVQDLITLAPVPNIPEPSSVVLALLGAFGLGMFVRRRR